jgi:hypothetical protein
MRNVLWSAGLPGNFFVKSRNPVKGCRQVFTNNCQQIEATRANTSGSGVETLLWNDRPRWLFSPPVRELVRKFSSLVVNDKVRKKGKENKKSN